MRDANGVVRSDAVRSGLLKTGGALAFALLLLAGCASQQDKAIEAAKKRAAATGQPQQVVTVDKAGNTTTTTIQPPAPGQTAETISTTTAPAPAQTPGGPLPTAPGTYYQPAGTVQGTAGGPQQAVAPTVQPADVNIPAGTELSIRINQSISVKHTPPGTPFDGEVVDPWVDGAGRIILPKGTPVGGIVDVSHRRGHFEGASVLELRLTSLTLNGTRYPLETHDLTRTKKGKGKRSAAMIGGGTGLGMLIGGVASGGTGLLIGGLAGAGAGTAGAGLTGNSDIILPAESIVHFKLADDLTLQG
ncbi:MAG: hypothetical protein ACLQM6_08470 [Acidobacteriaceae bacterium]